LSKSAKPVAAEKLLYTFPRSSIAAKRPCVPFTLALALPPASYPIAAEVAVASSPSTETISR